MPALKFRGFIFVAIFFRFLVTVTTNGDNMHRQPRDVGKILQDLVTDIKELSDKTSANNETLRDVQSFLTAIGFGQSTANWKPCGGENWLQLTPLTCVTMLDDLYTFDGASEACSSLFLKGTDLRNPRVLTIDSQRKQEVVTKLLIYSSITSIWIDRGTGNYSNWAADSPTGMNCTEIQNRRGQRGQWIDIECERTGNVMCEKDIQMSYRELLNEHIQLKMNYDWSNATVIPLERFDALRNQVDKQQQQTLRLQENADKQRQEMTTHRQEIEKTKQYMNKQQQVIDQQKKDIYKQQNLVDKQRQDIEKQQSEINKQRVDIDKQKQNLGNQLLTHDKQAKDIEELKNELNWVAARRDLEAVVATSLPNPLHATSLFYDDNDSIYIFGGWKRSEIYRFNITANGIEKIGHLTLSLGGGLVLRDSTGVLYLGGKQNETVYSHKIFQFDFTKNTLKEVGALEEEFAYGSSVNVPGNSSATFLIGGFSSERNYMRGININTLKAWKGSRVRCLYIGTTTFVHGENAIIFGQGLSHVEILNLRVLTSVLHKTTLPKFSSYPAVVTDGTFGYIIGGYERSPNYPWNGLIRFDPSTLRHEFVHVKNFPAGNSRKFAFASSVYVKKLNRIYIFGGHSYNPDKEHDKIWYIDITPLSYSIASVA